MLRNRLVRILLLIALAPFMWGGCASTEEAEGGEDAPSDRRVERTAPELQLALEGVRTVQLYRGSAERELPILPLGSEEQLTLEFDLMEAEGRPLSIYFYHADRTWRRDLTPSQYLTSFRDDNLLDYTRSRSTDVPYTHYVYRFPNESMDFQVSGNYVLRVTEQGQEEDVLFEHVFFVTEQSGALELGVEDVRVSGQRQPSELPVARFTPSSSADGSASDFNACFARNGLLETLRCSTRPHLAEQPQLLFDLPRQEAFAPAAADYFLDLSTLQTGRSIEGVDRTQEPPQVLLEPDYARFAGSGQAPRLHGQALVREGVKDAANPVEEAEYVSVRFAFVPPDEQPFEGDVYVTGSFSDGREHQLRWVPDRGRYEGDVLIKQGQYEYRYDSPDASVRAELRRALPRMDNRYLAFVYYSDFSLGTDRLLRVGGRASP